MIIALTGFMASGKSTFGRAAAERLGWKFLDLDEMIVHRYGPVAQLFDNKGEHFFREVEKKMLSEALHTSGDLILALGGGTVLSKANLRRLKNKTTIVWLDTSLEIILSELSNADRPLVRQKTQKEIAALYQSRRQAYQAAADIIFPVITDDYVKVIDDLAALIMSI